MATVTLLTETDAATPVALPGVSFSITDMSGTFVTEGVTDNNGSAVLTLPGSASPGTVYNVLLFLADSSFPPANLFPIHVLDPLGPGQTNEFTFLGHVGLEGQLVKLYVQDDQVTPNPIAGAVVRLFDETDFFLTQLTTPSTGELDVVLPGAPTPGLPYIVRIFPPSGYSPPSGVLTRTINVIDPTTTPNEFNLVVTKPMVPVTGDPLLCRLTGYVSNSSRVPSRNFELIFRPREGFPGNILSGLPFSGAPTILGSTILEGEVRVKPDRNGYLDFCLPRSSVFDVFVSSIRDYNISPMASVWIPNLAGIGIQDVLFPYVTSVTYGNTDIQLSLSANPSTIISLAVGCSNLQENVVGWEVFSALLKFDIDPELAVLSIVDGGLLIVAANLGSDSIVANRTVGSAAPRSPALPDIIALPSTPVVTVVA